MAKGARIVVVGGGYAGVVAALRARRRLGNAGTITLITAYPALVERVRLHEALATNGRIEHPLGALLAGTGVELVTGHVEGLDARGQRIFWAGSGAAGAPLVYDAAILATGSRITTGVFPGAGAHAVPLEVDTAAKLRARIEEAPPGAWVTVIGGGLTGVEAATELAEAYPRHRIRLVTGGVVGEGLSAGSVAHLRRVLDRLGVTLEERVRVEAVDASAVHTSAGVRSSTVTILASGFSAPPLARDAGLPVDDVGRLKVDVSLRVPGTAGLYAAGDAARMTTAEGLLLPMGCKAALPMGAQVGDAVVRELRGEAPAPVVYKETVYCLSLGRRDGILQAMHGRGGPRDLAARGRFGAFLKERVVRYTMAVVDHERRRAARAFALGRPAPESLPAAVAAREVQP